MTGTTYLLYADDSGDEHDSFYTAVLIPIPLWPVYLARWLRFRQWLYQQHAVPARYELHAYQWIPAKGPRPVPDTPQALINTSTGLRRDITVKALKTIAGMQDLGVLTCRHPGAVKADAYRAMITAVDTALAVRGDWAIVVTDGDPSNPDPHIHRAHRDLDIRTRRIVEDGWIQPAHASQLIQIADLAVHCAFQAHRHTPNRDFMWDWYATYLHAHEWDCACP